PAPHAAGAAPSPVQNASMAPTAPRPGDRSAPSVIGKDLTVTGNLSSKGQVQVDGEIQGDIMGTHVIVGETARITGGIAADEVVVRGRVQGSVRGKRVMLQANSHVEGDIFHKALAIEQGAFFEGKSRRSDDPIANKSEPPARPEKAGGDQNADEKTTNAPRAAE
ncbi:MAG: bactofilin family protein, partial [Methyloligellaceae bacterium]